MENKPYSPKWGVGWDGGEKISAYFLYRMGNRGKNIFIMALRWKRFKKSSAPHLSPQIKTLVAVTEPENNLASLPPPPP